MPSNTPPRRSVIAPANPTSYDGTQLRRSRPSVGVVDASTPLSHALLVRCAARWVFNKGFRVVEIEPVCGGANEIPDVIAWNGKRSVMVEVKVSRSDFARDKQKAARAHAHLAIGQTRYYCCPPGLLVAADMPPGWGLLYATATRTREIVKPPALTRLSGTVALNEIAILSARLARCKDRLAELGEPMAF